MVHDLNLVENKNTIKKKVKKEGRGGREKGKGKKEMNGAYNGNENSKNHKSAVMCQRGSNDF